MSSSIFAADDVLFCRAGGVPLYLDLRAPESKGPHPALVVVHGGGMVLGDRRMQFLPKLLETAAEKGYVAISVDYRLAGHHDAEKERLAVGALWPEPLMDVQCAIRWLRAHAAQYSVDTERIGVFGVSAGGLMSVLAAAARDGEFPKDGDLTPGQAKQSSRVAAAVDWFGPMDYRRMHGYVSAVMDKLPFIAGLLERGLRNVEAPMGGAPDLSAELKQRYDQASVTNYVRSDTPPIMAVHGKLDFVVPYAQSAEVLALAAQKAGIDFDLVSVAGAFHDLVGLAGQGNVNLSRSLAKSFDFLGERLKPQRTTPTFISRASARP